MTQSTTRPTTTDHTRRGRWRRVHRPHRPREPLDRRAVRGRHPRAARASSPPTARSSSGPASTPAARRRTSSSSTSPSSRDKIWWGDVNRPIAEEHYDRLRARLMAYCADRDLSTPRTASSAPHPAHRRSLRVYTETAWASIFARNLFRRPTAERARRLRARTSRSSTSRRSRPTRRPRAPGPGPRSSSTSSGWRSSSSAPSTPARSRSRAFTVMNYLMPDEGVLPMHSAINVGAGRRRGRLLRPVGDRQDDPLGRPAAQPDRRRRARLGRRLTSSTSRAAATPRRSASRRCTSPTSSQTTRRFGTILENVDLDPVTRELDLDSERFTENTRGAYPLDFIGNADATGRRRPRRATSSS